jgi:AraC-like DNA-binding protein
MEKQFARTGINSAAKLEPELQISSILLRVLADVMHQRGISPGAFMGSACTELYKEPAEHMLPLAEFQRVLAEAVRVSREPALGLHCGLYACEASFGLIAPVVSHARSLRHALELIVQFHGLLAEAGRIELVERAGVAQLRYVFASPLLASAHQFVEMAQAGFVRMLRTFGCTRADIRSVCFEYTRPQHHAAYTLAFGGVEHFGRSFTGIEVAADALDRPHLHQDIELHSLVLAQAERRMQHRTRGQRCAERVSALLRAASSTQPSDMDSLARKLGLSVRSLRRRLEEEGTSYRELTQDLVHEQACSLLSDPSRTLQSVAHTLGFADSTSFHRAFRRRAGLTPAQYRAKLHHGP